VIFTETLQQADVFHSLKYKKDVY